MPVASLPEELVEQLEQSGSGLLDSTEGPGVAAYSSSDGTIHADIYMGLKLDGFTVYDNISFVYPNIKMQFALEPDVLCQSDVITFQPGSDSVISIQVQAFLCLCSYTCSCKTLLTTDTKSLDPSA